MAGGKTGIGVGGEGGESKSAGRGYHILGSSSSSFFHSERVGCQFFPPSAERHSFQLAPAFPFMFHNPRGRRSKVTGGGEAPAESPSLARGAAASAGSGSLGLSASGSATASASA